ncbi:MAG: type II toxin-antitoxin system PemK/MazF family toxin [Dehalococcoidales bacterium]|nr:type II toxin-antitoxin system PemK/MazF family toxin [Dehalococcoidales bacterium]
MVKKWEIYYVDLNPSMGSEQSGVRPALIVSNDAINKYLPVCTVVPFSSFKEGDNVYPSELMLKSSYTGLEKDSILMFQQIRTISTSRLKQPMAGIVTNEHIREQIKNCLIEYFDLY